MRKWHIFMKNSNRRQKTKVEEQSDEIPQSGNKSKESKRSVDPTSAGTKDPKTKDKRPKTKDKR